MTHTYNPIKVIQPSMHICVIKFGRGEFKLCLSGGLRFAPNFRIFHLKIDTRTFNNMYIHR